MRTDGTLIIRSDLKDIIKTTENIHKDIEDIKVRLERLETLENRRASIGLKPFDENELNRIRTRFEYERDYWRNKKNE